MLYNVISYTNFFVDNPMARGRFKRWPVASENKGGPVSFTYDWSVRPVDIFTVSRKKYVSDVLWFGSVCHV